MDAAGLVHGHERIRIVVRTVLGSSSSASPPIPKLGFAVTASTAEALIKTFFDKKVGDFLKAEHLRSAFGVGVGRSFSHAH